MNGMINHMKSFHICLTGFAVICLIVLISMATPAAAADQDGGVYEGVPWRITADGTLLIGEEGEEYTFLYNDTRHYDSWPWYCYEDEQKVITKVAVLGKVYGNGSCESMFNGCDASSLDLSGFDTRKVTDMRYMFLDCKASSLDLTGFNTRNVTDMYEMFSNCEARRLDLSSFDTRNVTNMYGMFYFCKVSRLDLSSFDTRNVTNMGSMFFGCEASRLDLSSFNTRSVTSMGAMFDTSLEQITLGKWRYDSVSNPRYKSQFPIAMYDVSNKCKRYNAGKVIPENTNHTFITGFEMGNLRPTKVNLTGLKAGKKTMTVKWKKGKKPVEGYQIMYSTSSKFKKGKKTIKIKGLNKTTIKIKKLKSKKTYYVRVRAYRIYHNGTIYSNWGSVKHVQIK